MSLISAIITGHNEGVLAGPSLASMFLALDRVEAEGAQTEIIAILDRPDAVTREVFEGISERAVKIVTTDFGDPAGARNAGIAHSSGEYAAFMDADDLWSFNWLTQAMTLSGTSPGGVVVHSEINVVFGDSQEIWRHVDSESPGFDPGYMAVANYWDALSFGERALYAKWPFRLNALRLGYGHEDWFWNCQTLAAGIAHRPAPGTVHFKRRRVSSQMARCSQNDVVVYPNALTRLDFTLPPRPVSDSSCLHGLAKPHPRGTDTP